MSELALNPRCISSDICCDGDTLKSRPKKVRNSGELDVRSALQIVTGRDDFWMDGVVLK